MNHWDFTLVHVIADGKKKEQYNEIRPCPASRRVFSYCSSVSTGRPCRNSCSFAHSDVELAIWKAEQGKGLERANLLRPAVEATASPPDSAPQYQFYCRVCLVTCDSQQSFENHCSSVEHTQLIATDTLTEWTYRAPPYDPKTFSLCKRPDICEYGQDCARAHSVQELEEWIQRAKIAERKKKVAKQDGLLAYQDRLIAEYQTSHNEVLIISEAVDGVRVTCKQPLRIHSENKKLQYEWVFTIHSQVSWKGEMPHKPVEKGPVSPLMGLLDSARLHSWIARARMWNCWLSTRPPPSQWTSSEGQGASPSPASTTMKKCTTSSSKKKKLSSF
uniref:C3H1-type domain-containing protein n=1 Tax=Pseudonaja textilis TaxID=8673 RepID=A0A670ZAP2_PSETE